MAAWDLWTILATILLWSWLGANTEAQSSETTVLFHHRCYHASVVIGNYLYIDGGEITTWNGSGNGYEGYDNGQGNITTLPQNYTLAIDLTSPWNNQTLVLSQIRKGNAPVLNAETLWPDSSGDTFYSYNGGVSGAYQSSKPYPPENSLWQFTPSANGASGQWNQVSISTASNFQALSRTVDAASGFGAGLGFAIGGDEQGTSTTTDLSNGETYYTPGMVVFNTSSQVWYNESIRAVSYSQTAIMGAAQWAPSFGPAGLLFMFGGETPDGHLVTSSNSLNHQPFPLNILWMYDPSSRTWRSQTASGDVPSVMEKSCVVGIEGDDGTYEIFMYGQSGYWWDASEKTVEESVVYVLSLPSFHWQKQPAIATYSRNRHTCHVVGQSQMVVIGGAIGNIDAIFATDPWQQGIGILDLSTIEWSDSYDPYAPAYVTPQMVKDYVKQNPYPSAWSDPTVEEWFTKQKSDSGTGGSQASNKSNDTGAIAGGVVGGLVVIAIVGGLVYFVLRRRRQRRQPRQILEVSGKRETAELEAEVDAQETRDDGKPKEIDGQGRYELEGGWHGHETGRL